MRLGIEVNRDYFLAMQTFFNSLFWEIQHYRLGQNTIAAREFCATAMLYIFDD